MLEPIQVSRKILRYQGGKPTQELDDVVTEYPLTLFLNETEFATLVCTPEYLEEMVVGFLASEGVIGRFDEIKDILIDEKAGLAYIETHKSHTINQEFYSKRYITSCCGKSRQSFYFYNDAKTAKIKTDYSVFISYQKCFDLMNQMQSLANTFHDTGGVHNAALCEPSSLLLSRMDIGRHNALDKIYGHCLMQGISTDQKIIVFSGRISSEVLLKVAKIGCEVVLSKSAPTDLALTLAEELGITTVGFIRNQSLNVYTHPQRIIDEV